MSRQGRHGEAHFRAICQEQTAGAEAVLNPAADDMHGWDYVIDIVPPNDTRRPADLQTHLIQCFAQIKTTKGEKLQTKFKLSNAVKAAKSSSPSFVFLFHYGVDSLKPTLYGRHIWKDEIENYLKRARKTENSRKKELHSQFVSLIFSDNERIEINPIDWILSVLHRYGGENYAVKKLELVKSVGYSEFSHEGTITFGSSETIIDIVQHELGLSPDLSLREFRLFDKRFGIKSNEPVDEFKDGRISFAQDGKPLNLQITSSDGVSFNIPALSWAPTFIGIEHPDFRIRIKAGHINIITASDVKKQELKLNYDLASQHPFLEQLGCLCMLNWLQNGLVSFSVQTEIGLLFSGAITETLEVEPWMSQVELVGHHLIELLGREKCKEISLSYHKFYNISQEMLYVASIFKSGSFRFDAEFDDIIEPFEKLIGYVYGEVGKWTFGAIYEFDHKVRTNEGLRQTFYFTSPRIVSKFSYMQPIAKTREQIRRDFENYRIGLTVPVATVQNGDFVSWAEAISGNGVMEITVD